MKECKMEWAMLIKAILALAFVIGLLLLTLWAVKYLEMRGLNCRFMQKLAAERRLDLVEIKRVDSRNSVALIRCDNKEYVLLLGQTANLVIDSTLKGQKSDV